MPFTFVPQALAGLVLIHPQAFEDDRGCLLETYKRSDFEAAGLMEAFLQDNLSVSARGVLRGVHYQLPPHDQGKLVWVTRGSVWDVAVDLRRDSETFGRWAGVRLDAIEHGMFYLPPGFGHGFVALEDETHVLYKCTREYDPSSERGIRWDDPALAIAWPLRDVRVSEKDAELPLLANAQVFETISR